MNIIIILYTFSSALCNLESPDTTVTITLNFIEIENSQLQCGSPIYISLAERLKKISYSGTSLCSELKQL